MIESFKIPTANFPTVSGAVCTFNSQYEGLPLKSHSVDVVATQIGSGTPSPDNVRAISGWNGAVISHCGINLWDEETIGGYYQYYTGVYYPNNTELCSKNFIPVLPNTTYYYARPNDLSITGATLFYDANKNYIDGTSPTANKKFTTPNNCYFIKFNFGNAYGATYNNDISINYPSTDTSYHAYNGSKYQKYFEGLMNGTYRFVDLGSLTWGGASNGRVYSAAITDIKPITSSTALSNIIADKYVTESARAVYNQTTDKTICVAGAGYGGDKCIGVYDTTLANKSGAEIKTAMSGIYLICELATPTTPTITQSEIDTLISAFEANLNCVVFGQTVYGGVLDCKSGVGRIDKVLVELTSAYSNTISWNETYDGYRFDTRSVFSDLSLLNNANPQNDIVSNMFSVATSRGGVATSGYMIKVFNSTSDSHSFFLCSDDSNFPKNDKNAFLTWLDTNKPKVVYRIANPTEIQLSPVQLETLLAQNNIWCDTGDTSLQYIKVN